MEPTPDYATAMHAYENADTHCKRLAEIIAWSYIQGFEISALDESDYLAARARRDDCWSEWLRHAPGELD